MTGPEITFIISVARRAPLANMAEAEALARSLQKLAEHFAPKQPQNESPEKDPAS